MWTLARELKMQEAVLDEHNRHMNVTLAEARTAFSLSLRGCNVAIQCSATLLTWFMESIM